MALGSLAPVASNLLHLATALVHIDTAVLVAYNMLYVMAALVDMAALVP